MNKLKKKKSQTGHLNKLIKLKLLPTEGCFGLSCGSYEHSNDKPNEVSKDFRELNVFSSMFFFFTLVCVS